MIRTCTYIPFGGKLPVLRASMRAFHDDLPKYLSSGIVKSIDAKCRELQHQRRSWGCSERKAEASGAYSCSSDQERHCCSSDARGEMQRGSNSSSYLRASDRCTSVVWAFCFRKDELLITHRHVLKVLDGDELESSQGQTMHTHPFGDGRWKMRKTKGTATRGRLNVGTYVYQRIDT